jgi:predicted nucleotidyltransferase
LTNPKRRGTGFHGHLRNVWNIWKGCAASTMALQLPPDFKEFLKLLNSHQVKYLLIGGYAVGYYGYARATQDMDVWIAADPENADRIVRALADFGFQTSELSPRLFLEGHNIVRMGLPPMRIEVLTKISGVGFDESYDERIAGNIDGVDVTLISLAKLKINKRAAGRHKDLDDLERLP